MRGTLLQERYQIISVLGVGGFGRTYLAEDVQHSDRPPCVIKQFQPINQDQRFLDIARRLFQTEVETLRRLGTHPQIPDFLAAFEQEGEFYLVQEFIAGQALTHEFATTGKFDEGRAIALLQDVLSILEFVHSNQVIHRDIKPSNLIRRQQDDKIVLIDFGAVKAIQTQLQSRLLQDGHTGFTVGIGTQGYSPSEQLAGQPRFCSDIYALGVTVIQAITGLHPTQLPIDPDTGELIWREDAAISPGLEMILQKMVRYHFSNRFQSARSVLEPLQRFCEAALEPTDISLDALDETYLSDQTESQDETEPQTGDGEAQTALHEAGLPPVKSPVPIKGKGDRDRWRKSAGIVAVAALAVSSLVLGMRQLGWLEAAELEAYDRLVRVRPAAGVDPRLLVVGISEADLQALQRATPADRDVAQAIRNLAQHQPRVIGLDLHRELPQEPGHADLMQQLQASEVITVMKLGSQTVEIPPPAGTPPDRVGFSDIPVDQDGVVRRNLMLASLPNQEPFLSFSLQLVLKYLEPQDILPRNPPGRPDLVQIGEIILPPLLFNSGGYQQVDDRGYQILLDYPAPIPAQQIDFMQALNGTLDPSWVKDKIVLIGTTASSSKDLFFTPYSGSGQREHQNSNPLMPGVVLHAQMASQLLRTVLDHQPPFRFLPEWVEMGWIIIWAVIGAGFVWLVRHPLQLAIGIVLSFALLAGITFLLFINQLWIPLIAPAMSLFLASVAIVTYRGYR